MHVLASVVGVYCPGEQSMQCAFPVLKAKLPGEHAVQLADPEELAK